MSDSITSDQFDFLAARAGLVLTAQQKADVMATYPHYLDMIARNRKPRGRMAEPAHVFIPGEGVVA